MGTVIYKVVAETESDTAVLRRGNQDFSVNSVYLTMLLAQPHFHCLSVVK